MSEMYTAQEGDYMETIARKFGFRDYKIIYEDAKNTGLRILRPNPHILYPGDQVFIPDMNPGHKPAETDKRHKFEIKGEKVKLILYLRWNGKPLANQSYTLKVGSVKIADKTGKDGLIEKYIPVGEPDGLLTIPGARTYARTLHLGFLRPITTMTGCQMRLNNLGFGGGTPSKDETPAFTTALRAFQHEFQLIQTGKLDTYTLDMLRGEYDRGIRS